MGESPDLLALAVAGVNGFLDAAAPGDEFFLEHVSDNPYWSCDFTSDPALIRSKLDVKSKGRTALVDAIYAAVAAMSKSRNANRVLLVFSDGLDSRSTHHPEELPKLIASSPVPIFVVLTIRPFNPHDVLPDLIRRLGSQDLVRYTNRSGGYAVEVADRRQMSAAAADLAAIVRAPYVLFLASKREARIEVKMRDKHLIALCRALFVATGKQ
jgi:hypothetical protein